MGRAIAAQTRASVIPAHDHFAAATETVLSFLDIEVSESYWTSEVLLDQRRVRYSFNQIVTLGQKLDDGRPVGPLTTRCLNRRHTSILRAPQRMAWT